MGRTIQIPDDLGADGHAAPIADSHGEHSDAHGHKASSASGQDQQKSGGNEDPVDQKHQVTAAVIHDF